jgi:hypothetical protein
MTPDELKQKIKTLAADAYKSKQKVETASVEWDELTKFPELKEIIVKLLTDDFNSFLSSIDWVAPRPSTFRINLKNNQEFYLLYGTRSWIAQVEGKKYYLLNLPEEQHASEAISRILRYGSKEEAQNNNDGFNDFDVETPEKPSKEETPPTEETPA